MNHAGIETRVGDEVVQSQVPAPVILVSEKPMSGHRLKAIGALAVRIARLRGSEFIDTTARTALPSRFYAVPTATLVGNICAARLGVETEEDLFGGLVSHAVQAGKTITHPLVNSEAPHPEGWRPAFAESVHAVVLNGYSAFDIPSARKAGEILLALGPIRLKAAWADGGHSQSIVTEPAALDGALAAFDTAQLSSLGLVLEQNLAGGRCFSVGRARIGSQVLSYVGQQFTTRDNAGGLAYGGSTLTLVPGEFAELRRLELDHTGRQAVEAALTYDHAATRHFPGLIASRLRTH